MPLKERLAHIPERPGVYLFRNKRGEVIYVGKAASLKNRVRSYLNPPADPKTASLVASIADVEFIVVPSETQALILESDLVKRYRPRYNIRLKDDKSWLYIHLTDDEFPRICLTREVRPEGRYYGPFTSARAVRQGFKVLRKAFRLKACREEAREDGRVCLDYQIGLCSGPCAGLIGREEYMESVEELDAFLTGKHRALLRRLKKRMLELSRGQEFEKAGVLRDRIEAMERLIEGQRRTIPVAYYQDVAGIARGKTLACVQVFAVRDGRILGREQVFLEGVEGEAEGEILATFLKQYYSGRRPPREVVVGAMPGEAEAIEAFLSEQRGKRVRLVVPKRGKRVELLQTAERNARYSLLRAEEREKAASLKRAAVLELREALGLSMAPRRIEAFDVSNISGKMAVGSMVAFRDGVADKAGYRRYKIRGARGPDDPGMIREVVTRRYSRHPPPDLVVVDGGAAQVGAAVDALRELGIGAAVAGLAKRQEEVYLPERPEPLRLPADSKALLLLREIRDEAHRFAVAYHRRLRAKGLRYSALDDVPGIGKAKKRALLKRFGSVEGVRRASVEE
ncbi:MAG: excinuclease ABC subunit UvrC, partial [Euryarchaeota archaeon]|nr:excinuclease ABC subunit UvrC [Euryarchaeota archaeon]